MSTTTAPHPTSDGRPREGPRQARRRRGQPGQALEWFDIIVYAFFAVVISKNYFEGAKGGSEYVAMLLTFGTFALSYLIRPIGAMVIGHYGDKHGRKGALSLRSA